MKKCKKIMLFSGLFLLAGVFGVSMFTQSSYATSGGNIGPNDANKRNSNWLWVYNTDNVAHEPGDVVVWKDGDHDGLDIATTTSYANMLVAGVVVGSTISATSWGFIQTHGYCPLVNLSSAVAAGDNHVKET